MVYSNRVRPVSNSITSKNFNDGISSGEPNDRTSNNSSLNVDNSRNFSTTTSLKELANNGDLDSLSTVGLEESSYLKLRPFTKLDPTSVRLLNFLTCFGLTVNFDSRSKVNDAFLSSGFSSSRFTLSNYTKYLKILIMICIVVISGEVVYDVNLRQSKLLAEQKRSTPLLTFVIVAYSWMSLVIPVLCDISLLFIGSLLFRFYSRTTATVCNGIYFGKRASVDSWYYYLTLIIIAFLDAAGQIIVLGVWPPSIDPYMKMMILEGGPSSTADTIIDSAELNELNGYREYENMNQTNNSLSILFNSTTTGRDSDTSIVSLVTSASYSTSTSTMAPHSVASQNPRIKAYLLDYLLGVEHANGDLGVCVKFLCLMIQFIHSYAFFIIIISLAHHYATAINDINDNLDKYEFRRLLKQLIILRDSSEQISLMISLPFSCITIFVFMRQIALNGVIIQSTMLPYENLAVSLQAFTCTVSIIMVFIYCDGLQSASKQTHRLKTEHTVINENKGGNQSIYEFLDYLNRLSKSIRITFFNIIIINKSSLVGLFGHILTLTFVTS